MKNKLVFIIYVTLVLSYNANAQTSADYAIQIDVTVQENPNQIILNWINDINATQYKIYRKDIQAVSWGNIVATLPGTTNQYIDLNVQSDTAYEYQIYKTTNSSVTANGYVYAGIKKPAIHYNGRVLVIIDSLFIDSVRTELLQFRKDLASDGWDVSTKYFARTNSISLVKNYINEEYNISSNNVIAVLLIGHIPVPYSGQIAPDGHTDHRGAWPADVYYGDVDGVWTDYSTNATGASRAENINIPGDGKFDQSYIPSNIDLQVSRIDFYNMPSSGKSEFQMLRNYLNRDHAYRKKLIEVKQRGLIDDNFGSFNGEAFASNGFKNFAPLVGKSNILEIDFLSTLDTTSYLWAYGCGGGYYNSASGIGNSTQVMNQNVNTIFTMLFGSYFGDWDSQDNFLRAQLCANVPALTSAWVGRPHWVLHTMGLGLNIGYGTRVSQNNSNTYIYGARQVHIALMGDLTLKQNILSPPQSVSLQNTLNEYGKIINWSASTDSVLGYFVYRSNSEFEGYTLISNLINENSFTDLEGTDGLKYYLVRAMRLETTPSGTYYNLSEGIGNSSFVKYQTVSMNNLTNTGNDFQIYPNPFSEEIHFKVNSIVSSNMSIRLLNLLGKVVFESDAFKTNENINLNQDLIPGTYIVEATINGKKIFTKICKL